MHLVYRLLICLVILPSFISTNEDFYQLLGITKAATQRDIRRAFKRIALEKHPDKRAVNRNACFHWFYLLNFFLFREIQMHMLNFYELTVLMRFYVMMNWEKNMILMVKKVWRTILIVEISINHGIFINIILVRILILFFSWNSSRFFVGIYDEDPEIITLSRADFRKNFIYPQKAFIVIHFHLSSICWWFTRCLVY